MQPVSHHGVVRSVAAGSVDRSKSPFGRYGLDHPDGDDDHDHFIDPEERYRIALATH